MATQCNTFFHKSQSHLGRFAALKEVLMHYDAVEGNTAEIGREMYRYTNGAWVKMSDYVSSLAATCGLIDTARFAGVYSDMKEVMHHNPCPIEGTFAICLEKLCWVIWRRGKWIEISISKEAWESLKKSLSDISERIDGIEEKADQAAKDAAEARRYAEEFINSFNVPDLTVHLVGGQPWLNPRRFRFTLHLLVVYKFKNITKQIPATDIVWTRYSEDKNGYHRLASDKAWAVKRADAAHEIELTQEDIDRDIGGVPPICEFICTVTLRDELNSPIVYEIHKRINF